MISILPYGDTAMLINFEQRIDRMIHARVALLGDILKDIAGITDVIPAYCSLTVVFDRTQISYGQLKEAIDSVDLTSIPSAESVQSRKITVPVCYDPEFGPDLEAVSLHTGKTIEEIIQSHLNTEFYVYMLGFMPGFVYMGDMPEAFFCHRKPVPRTRVPRGSVGLAGLQTAIYPFESPGGWQIIGRTPVVLFDPQKEPPNLFMPGDLVRFKEIGKDEFGRHPGIEYFGSENVQ